MKPSRYFVLLCVAMLFLFSCHYLVHDSLSILYTKKRYDNYVYAIDRDTSQTVRRKLRRVNHSEGLRKSNATSSAAVDQYAQSLIEKDRLRKSFLQKWISTQEELRLHPTNSTRYVIFYPTYAGLGNTLAVLAEAIVISWVTNRRLRSINSLFELFYRVVHKYSGFQHYFTLPLTDYYYEDASRGSDLKDDV